MWTVTQVSWTKVSRSYVKFLLNNGNFNNSLNTRLREKDLKTKIHSKLHGHLLSKEDGKQETKKVAPHPHRTAWTALPRRSLSIVTPMSSRNVIRHCMRSDTGGLLVWHIRDMLGINMQWCQLKAWNALRGEAGMFSLLRKQPDKVGKDTWQLSITLFTWSVCRSDN